jgi:hypothetical protein
MSKDLLKNNIVKMFNTNKGYAHNEIARLGSREQRSAEYRRNGILNFGGRQMINIAANLEVYTVGVGGPPVVG